MADQITADVLKQDGPTAEDNAEVTLTANADEAGEGDHGDENDNDDEIKGKRLGGWQRKIKRLEIEKETLIEALRKGGGNAQAPQKQETAIQEDKPPVKPVRPKQAEFDDWNKYEAAVEKYETDRDDYHEKNLAFQLRKQETVKQQQSHQQTIADGFAAQAAEARKELKDFDAVAFSADVPMSNAMMEAIVTSELGAKVAYELGKNPDEAERISKLSPVAAIREIGKIESRIAGTKPAADEDKDEEPPAATTRAPRPPVPVRKTSSNPTELGDEVPYKEWLRRREAQLRSK